MLGSGPSPGREVGKLVVGEPAAQGATARTSSRSGCRPPAIGERGAGNRRVELVAEEVVGQLATHGDPYFTFNGRSPPHAARAVGDTVEVAFRNESSSVSPLGRFHARPAAAARSTATAPRRGDGVHVQGAELGCPSITARAGRGHHIANGMLRDDLVERKRVCAGGPRVLRDAGRTIRGNLCTPGYVRFGPRQDLPKAGVLRLQRRGGRADSEEHALRAKVGETVRIYFGVAARTSSRRSTSSASPGPASTPGVAHQPAVTDVQRRGAARRRDGGRSRWTCGALHPGGSRPHRAVRGLVASGRQGEGDR